MVQMDAVQKRLFQEVADLHDIPEGAYNLRANGQSISRNTTANIDIQSKTDVSGIDIRIKSGTKNESVHIPVVLSESGIKEDVYNDFYIGEDCDVLIVAGCGIDNCGSQDSEHDGIHRFYIGKNSRYTMLKSTTVRVTVAASVSSILLQKFTWRTAALWKWKWCR